MAFGLWHYRRAVWAGVSAQVWAQLAADSPGVDSTFGLLSSSSDFSRPFLLLQAWGWDDRAINKLDFDFTFLERTLNIWSFSDHKECDWELCGWLNPRSQLECMEASSRQGESLQRSMSWPGWGNKVRNGLHVALWASGFLGQKRSIDCGDRFGPLDTDRVHSWSLEEPKYCKLVHSYGKICWNTTFEQLAGNVFRSKPSSFNDLFMNHFDPHLVSSFSSFTTFITFTSFTTLITFTTFSMFSTRLPCLSFWHQNQWLPQCSFFSLPEARFVIQYCYGVQRCSKHTWYLSRTHGRCPWRKNLSCGEISNSVHDRWGEI